MFFISEKLCKVRHIRCLLQVSFNIYRKASLEKHPTPLLTLRKPAYSNILKILQPKKGFFFFL